MDWLEELEEKSDAESRQATSLQWWFEVANQLHLAWRAWHDGEDDGKARTRHHNHRHSSHHHRNHHHNSPHHSTPHHRNPQSHNHHSRDV